MSDSEQLTVTLPRALAAQLRQAVANGEYASISDAVAAALALWDDGRDAVEPDVETLRRLATEGLASGEPVEAGIVFDALRARIGKPRAAE
ncbi:MAG: type II toxin-antitoxin system ParD family antitoxin [Acetobacteraceae bacterium]|nr:type II toxin-antitoxin system ParD family antitoxin [Acetobacteraceae bacterium]